MNFSLIIVANTIKIDKIQIIQSDKSTIIIIMLTPDKYRSLSNNIKHRRRGTSTILNNTISHNSPGK